MPLPGACRSCLPAHLRISRSCSWSSNCAAIVGVPWRGSVSARLAWGLFLSTTLFVSTSAEKAEPSETPWAHLRRHTCKLPDVASWSVRRKMHQSKLSPTIVMASGPAPAALDPL